LGDDNWLRLEHISMFKRLVWPDAPNLGFIDQNDTAVYRRLKKRAWQG